MRFLRIKPVICFSANVRLVDRLVSAYGHKEPEKWCPSAPLLKLKFSTVWIFSINLRSFHLTEASDSACDQVSDSLVE